MLDEERFEEQIERSADLRSCWVFIISIVDHVLQSARIKPDCRRRCKIFWRGMVYLWCQFLVDLVRL
jgi:hypothetical protein